MDFRARFAPSPTGQVHIGNIRTAIFNWLYTRHCGGEFLLRVEDTDLERSTKQAIDALFECMQWLGLDYDGVPMYQTSQSPHHKQVALDMIARGLAYKLDPASENSPVLFRLPYDCDSFQFVRSRGPVRVELAPDTVCSISRGGLVWSSVNHKGKAVESAAGLSGFKDLKVFDGAGKEIFALSSANIREIEGLVEPRVLSGAAAFEFIRREVFFKDLVKGELSKPLDSIKDFIIVRSDGSPVFHIANVCDDITQKVTHIVRGDDHVENTFRHLFLFQALGFPPPAYAHLPMLVNASGKPFSKRDGDAYVGDFREKGYLPQALFNYLSLLGWSPGDNREKMSRQELIEAFSIERAQHSPAQFDMVKLANMNGLYVAEMSEEDFQTQVWDFAKRFPWYEKASRELFNKVAVLMHSRTKTYQDAAAWSYFFDSDFEYDAKGVKKFLNAPEVWKALSDIAESLEKVTGDLSVEAAQDLVRATEEANGFGQWKLSQPLRVALTGVTVGAGMHETMAVLGAGESAKRLRAAAAKLNA